MSLSRGAAGQRGASSGALRSGAERAREAGPRSLKGKFGAPLFDSAKIEQRRFGGRESRVRGAGGSGAVSRAAAGGPGSVHCISCAVYLSLGADTVISTVHTWSPCAPASVFRGSKAVGCGLSVLQTTLQGPHRRANIHPRWSQPAARSIASAARRTPHARCQMRGRC